jgi:NADPH:quinone reductase
MKALVFEKPGELAEVIHLSDVEKPKISATQVLVSVKARPVNPSDHLFVRGVYRKKPVYPQIAGLEGSGMIIECGELVVGFQAGDHVAFRALNTWAEYCAVEQEKLIKINQDLPFDVSAQVGLNAITAVALLEEANVPPGGLLLLNAASSSLSGLVIQLALAKGIRVIALVNDEKHRQALMALGVENVFLQQDVSLFDKLGSVTNQTGINGFLDAVGGQINTTVIPLMGAYGHVVIYGNFSKNSPATFVNGDIIYKNLTIIGFGIDYWLSQQPARKVEQAYRRIVDDLFTGKLSFRKTVSIPLTEFSGSNDRLQDSDKLMIVTA